MRFLAMVMGLVLGAGVLLLSGAPEARADSTESGDAAPIAAVGGDPAAAQPGTDAEARDYAQREADSPEAREFVGGDGGGLVFAILVIGLLVILFLYLDKQGKI